MKEESGFREIQVIADSINSIVQQSAHDMDVADLQNVIADLTFIVGLCIQKEMDPNFRTENALDFVQNRFKQTYKSIVGKSRLFNVISHKIS